MLSRLSISTRLALWYGLSLLLLLSVFVAGLYGSVHVGLHRDLAPQYLHSQLHQLRWLLVAGILLGSGAAVGIGVLLARRSLRPVIVLTEAARFA